MTNSEREQIANARINREGNGNLYGHTAGLGTNTTLSITNGSYHDGSNQRNLKTPS